MIVGSGVDVVDIARLERVMERRGEAFARRVYTAREVRACRDALRPARAFALRFAAKEAALKALGTGWGQGVGFRDVEVVEGPFDPVGGADRADRFERVELHGAAARRAAGARAHLALASGPYRALALVLLEAP